MNVLIIEDDPHKGQQIETEVAALLPNSNIERRMSYQSGLRRIVDGNPAIVLLDMTMPTFDESERGGGGRPRPFAGRDILYEMRRRNMTSKVIVVTQFERFGEGPQRQARDELASQLASQFPSLFAGMVYYSPLLSDWKMELRSHLTRGTSSA